MPLVDRLPEEAPPVIVAVVGPPGVRLVQLHLKISADLKSRWARLLSSSPSSVVTANTPSAKSMVPSQSSPASVVASPSSSAPTTSTR